MAAQSDEWAGSGVGTDFYSWAVGIDDRAGSKRFGCNLGSDGSVTSVVTAPNTWDDGKWHHVVCVFNETAITTWTITFYIEDLATPTPGSDSDNSATANVGQLKAILYNTNINLGIITPSDVNVPLADVVITNEGNFVVPTDGTLNVLARNLVGVTTPAESILASVFLAGDSSGDVCTLGSALIDNSNVNTNVAIPRGAAGSNVGSLGFCISLVPEVSAQDYEATVAGGNPWLIEI